MGFGDNAIHVLNSNRKLLKKNRTFKEIKDSYLGYVKDTKLEFKQLTKFEQKKIRDKIKVQAKKDRKHNIQMHVLAFLILCGIFLALYVLFG